ncbi:MAG: hypothetical protein HAW67_01370 [Endozoicomonadaceae bacterium]|nr:hypothetical protein [Endozoicomonadaceae bacterium]
MNNDIEVQNERPDVIEIYYTLSPSEYWKCLNNEVHPQIKQGHVLLITQIDDVDNKAHTIHLRLHPSVIKSEYSTNVKMLLNDFVNNFEHIPQEEAKQQRQDDIKKIQGKLGVAQDELLQALTSAPLLDEWVERDNPTTVDKEKSLPIQYEAPKADVINAIKTQKLTALMNPSMNEAGLENIKANMEHHKNIAIKRSDWITTKTRSLSSIAQEMTPYFEEQSALALAATSDIQKHIAEIMKGISNLNLYILKNVEINELKKGDSAPFEEKLTITQKVLFMDEEMAVHKPVDKDFDCTNREYFFEELTISPELIAQIFPSDRCVVGMAATRHYRDYDHYSAIEAVNRKRENKKVFLMVKDGENIYAVVSPECFHQFTNTLFPSMDEIQNPFMGFDGRDITYNDINYTDSLSEYKMIELGYKRMLILLCGLDHSKSIFGDFYLGDKDLNFVSQEFQEKHFHFIHDADGEGLLGNPYRPESYYDWLSDLNSEISQGSRILVDWRSAFTEESIRGAYEPDSDWSRSKDYKDRLYDPVGKPDFLVSTVKRQKERLIIDVNVTGLSKGYKKRTFTTPLDISKVCRYGERDSLFCLDRFNVDDALFYLHDRASRTLNVSGINLLKKVIEFAKTQRDLEAPVHSSLVEAMLVGSIADNHQEAVSLVDRALGKWKCSNPNKCVTTLLSDNKAYNRLCDQTYQLSNKAKDIVDDVISAEKLAGREPLRITITATGQYCAYSLLSSVDVDDRFVPFEWVARTRYLLKKTGVKAQPITYVRLTRASNNETVKYESDDFEEHILTSSIVFNSPADKEALLSRETDPLGKLDEIERIKNAKSDVDFLALLETYIQWRKNNSVKMVFEPSAIIELGYRLTRYGDLSSSMSAISLVTTTAKLLAYMASNNERQIALISGYISLYKDKKSNMVDINNMMDEVQDKPLYKVLNLRYTSVDETPDQTLISNNTIYQKWEPVAGYSYSLQKSLDNVSADNKYFIESMPKDIDEALGIKAPEKHFPCILFTDTDSLRKEKAWLFPYVEGFNNMISTSGSHTSRTVYDSIEDAESALSDYHYLTTSTDSFDDLKKVNLIPKTMPVEDAGIKGDIKPLRYWTFTKQEVEQ